MKLCICMKQIHQGILTLNRRFCPKYQSIITFPDPLSAVWRHPFTAEDPLVSKWFNAKFLQICCKEKTNYSFKCHQAKTKWCVRDFAYLPSSPGPGGGLTAVAGARVWIGVVGVGAGGEWGPRDPLVLLVCYISRRGRLNSGEWLEHCGFLMLQSENTTREMSKLWNVNVAVSTLIYWLLFSVSFSAHFIQI